MLTHKRTHTVCTHIPGTKPSYVQLQSSGWLKPKDISSNHKYSWLWLWLYKDDIFPSSYAPPPSPLKPPLKLALNTLKGMRKRWGNENGEEVWSEGKRKTQGRTRNSSFYLRFWKQYIDAKVLRAQNKNSSICKSTFESAQARIRFVHEAGQKHERNLIWACKTNFVTTFEPAIEILTLLMIKAHHWHVWIPWASTQTDSRAHSRGK